MEFHQTAIISSRAKIGKDCTFGPYTIVEDDVEIGDRCFFEPFSVVKRGSVVGSDNYVCEGAIIGGFPQCLGLKETKGLAVVGDRNIIREHVTIQRSIKDDDVTAVGNDCMLMVNAHIAHDCKIGNNVLIANNVMLAGHVTIHDRANLSGAVGVHQFCRIGRHAMVGGQARVTRDVPPYMLVDGESTTVVGLNVVGLKRAGFSHEEFRTLKDVYRILYHSELSWSEILQKMEAAYTSGLGLEILEFVKSSERGILRDRISARKSQRDSGDTP